MSLEIHVLRLNMHKNVAGISRLMGLQLSPPDNWVSNDNIEK